MMLPRLLVLTDRHQAPRSLWDVVELILKDGAQCIVFREKDLPYDERLTLGRRVAERVRGAGATLIVASDVTLATELGADAVHFAANDVIDDTLPFGKSCHSSEDIVAAARCSASYATLSPIFASASKPGYGPALGTHVLVDSPLPVYALGGIDVTNAATCIRAGAAGVAVMGALMRATDPTSEVKAIVSTLQ